MKIRSLILCLLIFSFVTANSEELSLFEHPYSIPRLYDNNITGAGYHMAVGRLSYFYTIESHRFVSIAYKYYKISQKEEEAAIFRNKIINTTGSAIADWENNNSRNNGNLSESFKGTIKSNAGEGLNNGFKFLLKDLPIPQESIDLIAGQASSIINGVVFDVLLEKDKAKQMENLYKLLTEKVIFAGTNTWSLIQVGRAYQQMRSATLSGEFLEEFYRCNSDFECVRKRNNIQEMSFITYRTVEQKKEHIIREYTTQIEKQKSGRFAPLAPEYYEEILRTIESINATVFSLYLKYLEEKKHPPATASDPIKYTLSIGKKGKGLITSNPSSLLCGSVCNDYFQENISITLNATASDGYTFSRWEGGCTGSTASCNITMNKAQNVMAVFEPNPPPIAYNLAVKNYGNGVVTSLSGIDCGNDCNEVFATATSVTLSASPVNSLYYFTGWDNSSCSGTGDCTLNVNQSLYLKAYFESCISINHLWQKTGDLYAGTTNNFDAQFKITNKCATAQSLENAVISLHRADDHSYYTTCYAKGAFDLSANGSFDTGFQYCTVNDPGEYELIAKTQTAYDGWINLAIQNVTFLPSNRPASPNQPSASDGSFTDKVNISWNTVLGATSYKIYRCLTGLKVTCALIGSTTGTSYNDTEVEPQIEYFYRVKSSHSTGGDSDYSVVDKGYRAKLIDLISEDPTTNLSQIYQPDTDTFKINWQGNQSTNKVEIYASYDNSSWTNIISKNQQQGSQTVTIANSKSYTKIYFKVRSTDTSNNVSDTSNSKLFYYTPKEDTVVPKETEKPNIPQLSSLGQSTSNNYVTLRWQRVNDSNYKDNVNYYEIKFADNYSFNNAATVNAGNNAAGQNIYESVSYTISNLTDEKTYYFRVRAVNGAGTSSWSSYQSIQINIADLPYFDSSYQFPANNSQGVSKSPEFKWKAYDSDGDNLEYYISYGESADSLFFDSDWIENGNDYFRFTNSLRPNTKYYWKVQVREDGYYSDFYGGNYIESPIWNFTTSSEGPDLSITNLELIGEIAPDSYAKFRLVVQNIGTEAVTSQFIRTSYKKGDKVTPFKIGGTVLMPQDLLPGESVTVDIDLDFQDHIITNGITEYDNILVEGTSYIIFYIDDETDANIFNNTHVYEITYTNQGLPIFGKFYLGSIDKAYNGENTWPFYDFLGGEKTIVRFSADDDMNISRATVEYRINETDVWHLLQDYTSKGFTYDEITGSSVDFDADHIGVNYMWIVPNTDDHITGSMQIRVRIYESDLSYTEKITYPFPVYTNENITFTDFNVDKTEIDLDRNVTFSWVANGSNRTLYSVFIKPANQSTGWEQLFSVQGVLSKNIEKFNYLDGTYNIQVRAGSSSLVHESALIIGKQTIDAPVINDPSFTILNNVPTINLSFSSVANADSYLILRGLNDNYTEIATVATTSYSDVNIVYGTNYTYKVVSNKGDLKSELSLGKSITAKLAENYTVSINNANYQSLSSNSLTLTYVPSQSVSYEKYEIRLGKAPNNLSTYAFTNNRSVFLSNLDYGQTYYIEVYPVDYINTRLTSQPAKLTFSTAFDTRVITTQPVLTLNEISLNSISFSWDTVTDADYYYICRSENGGDFSCFDITFDRSYTDYINLIDGNSYRYIVKAVNGYSSLSSTATSDVTIGGNDSSDICQVGGLSINSPVTYTTSATIQSDTSILGQTTIVVNNGITISYQAPSITLKPGFHAQAGSQFTAKAMAVNCSNETLSRHIASGILIFSAKGEEFSPESDIVQVKNNLISKQINKKHIPLTLRQLLDNKEATVQSLQTDASGDIILFSTETGLVAHDNNDVSDIYVYHTPSATLTLVSATDKNNAANGASTEPMINGSGEFVLYNSEASDLIGSAEDTNQVADIYLYHIGSEQTLRVSSKEDGSQTSHASGDSSLAGNKPNIIYDKASDTHQQHVYSVDTNSGSLSSIKQSKDYNNWGEQINNAQPSISSDGRYLVYLEISTDNSCKINIQDQKTNDFIRIQCPEAISHQHSNWKPHFDSTASKIQWYNQRNGDKLNMDNPLFTVPF